MSIKKGNDYWKKGELQKAIEEYNKIPKNSPLYHFAQQNINHIKKSNIDTSTIKNMVVEEYKSTIKELPLISVIMPVFNVAPYLDASILSVRGQSYENLEIIIVNDASTDNGIDIIRMHEKLDIRINVIDLEFNTLGGAGIPSNIGVEHAKGKYIAYADSDDILDKYAIEKMVSLAEKEDLEVVIADFCNFSEEDREVKVAYDKEKWKGFPLEKAFSPLGNPEILRLSPVPWRKLYKRDFLVKHDIKFPEGDYFFEDNPLHWFVLARAKRVALLDYVVAYHRMGREGQTMSSGAYKLAAFFEHFNRVRKILKHSYSNNKESLILLNEWVKFVFDNRWIINRQNSVIFQNIFKKRLAQEINKEKKHGFKNYQSIKSRIDNFNSSYEDIELTIIIKGNKGNILKNINKYRNINIKYNIYIISNKESDPEKEIEIINEKTIIFNIDNGNNRIINTILPLCIGKYTLIDLNYEGLIKIDELFRKVKNNKLDFFYKEEIFLFRSFYRMDNNIFFGTSNTFSSFSFYWLQVLNSNKIDVEEYKINLSSKTIELYQNEIMYIIRQITYIEKEKKDLFFTSVLKETQNLVQEMNLNEFTKFHYREFNLIKSFLKNERK